MGNKVVFLQVMITKHWNKLSRAVVNYPWLVVFEEGAEEKYFGGKTSL